MAIFGSLNQMSLSDLLPLMSVKKGALELFNLDKHPNVTLYFDSGVLRCAFKGPRELTPPHARALVTWLLGAHKGSFEFIPEATPRRCEFPLGWPVTQLLLSTVTVRDEIEHHRAHLPHPDTVYRLVSSAHPEDGFLREAQVYLTSGSSARRLAAALDLPLDQVRYQLLKLSQAGVVVIARRKQTTKPEQKGAAARLLSALKSRFAGRRTWKP